MEPRREVVRTLRAIGLAGAIMLASVPFCETFAADAGLPIAAPTNWYYPPYVSDWYFHGGLEEGAATSSTARRADLVSRPYLPGGTALSAVDRSSRHAS